MLYIVSASETVAQHWADTGAAPRVCLGGFSPLHSYSNSLDMYICPSPHKPKLTVDILPTFASAVAQFIYHFFHHESNPLCAGSRSSSDRRIVKTTVIGIKDHVR